MGVSSCAPPRPLQWADTRADGGLKVSISLALIEDHPALRQGLGLLLAQEGCMVVGSAGGVADGQDLVRRFEPDVIVVDISLGEESGIDLTRALLTERAERRIVLYTGTADVDV